MNKILQALFANIYMNEATEGADGGGAGPSPAALAAAAALRTRMSAGSSVQEPTAAAEPEAEEDPDEELEGMSFDELANATLDDVEDIPDFEVPPVGSYLLNVQLDRKTVNDKDCIEASFTVEETIELANEDDKPAAKGTKFSILYQLGNKYGLGNYKKLAKPFFAQFGFSSYGEFYDAVHTNPVLIGCNLKHRKGKKERAGEVYADVRDIVFA